MARTPQKQTHHLLTQAMTQLGKELQIDSPENLRRKILDPNDHLLRAMTVVIAGELALKKIWRSFSGRSTSYQRSKRSRSRI